LPFVWRFTNDFSAEEKRSPRFRFGLDIGGFRILERFYSCDAGLGR
jgi:hypothetical protein